MPIYDFLYHVVMNLRAGRLNGLNATYRSFHYWR